MTQLTRPREAVPYDRVAGIYDLYTSPMEVLGGRQARQPCSAAPPVRFWNSASAPG